LVVSNHSGGISTPDVLIFASVFYDEFGYDRPVYTLAHDGVFMDPLDGKLHRAGVIKASRENAAALHSDYDAYRPTLSANNIDFNGRTGYVRTAPEAAVPIVPSVDRRPGDPAVPDPRQLVGPQVGAHQGPDGHTAGPPWIPVRAQRDLPAQPAAGGQGPHRGPRADRRHRWLRRRPRRRRGRRQRARRDGGRLAQLRSAAPGSA
jgi:Acyltransferase